jgi:hypothetical protein
MLGMVICAGGVALVNRGTSPSSNMAAQSRSKRSPTSSLHPMSLASRGKRRPGWRK